MCNYFFADHVVYLIYLCVYVQDKEGKAFTSAWFMQIVVIPTKLLSCHKQENLQTGRTKWVYIILKWDTSWSNTALRKNGKKCYYSPLQTRIS